MPAQEPHRGRLPRATPALVMETVGVATGAGVIGALQWTVLSSTGTAVASLWTSVVAWVVVGVVRSTMVQRCLGGGRLDNRAQLRILIGGLAFLAPLCLTGTPWMLSGAMAVVTSVHVGWSGYKTWRWAAAQAVTGAVGVQFAVHRGWVPSAITPAHSDVVAVVGTSLALLLLLNCALVTRDRDRAEAALAAERAAHDAVLRHAATHDKLTDLVDREGMSARVQDALAHAAPGSGVCVLFCDLDGFKAVNDTLGHAAGDALLLEVARRLQSAVRARDDVARIGGDEFLVLLTDVGDEAVVQTALRLEAELSAGYSLPQGPATIGVSIGAATTYSPATSVAQLLKDADQAMYAVKATHHTSNGAISARR